MRDSAQPEQLVEALRDAERVITMDEFYRGDTYDVVLPWAVRVKDLATALSECREALREAALHQGLPEDATPERIAAHFRNNREYREGWDALAAQPPSEASEQ